MKNFKTVIDKEDEGFMYLKDLIPQLINLDILHQTFKLKPRSPCDRLQKKEKSQFQFKTLIFSS